MDDTNFTIWACSHYPRLVVSARLVARIPSRVNLSSCHDDDDDAVYIPSFIHYSPGICFRTKHIGGRVTDRTSVRGTCNREPDASAVEGAARLEPIVKAVSHRMSRCVDVKTYE